MNSQAQRSYRWLFWTLALLGGTLDLSAKYLIFASLYTGGVYGEHELIPEAFRLSTQYAGARDTGSGLFSMLRTMHGEALPRVNEGALFGLGHGNNSLFTLVSLIAAAGIIYWSARSGAARDPFLTVALGLILAGTLGNLYDRVIFGGVRDFLHWYYWIDWPVFNFADCCLVTGASMLLVQAVFFHPATSSSPTPVPAQEPVERVAPTPQPEIVEVK
jgi:lipoprotein signal peptidase